MAKASLLGLILFWATSTAAAEEWNCTHLAGVSDAVIERFVLAPPDLIDAGTQERYHIVQNNEKSLIAAISISQNQDGQQEPTIGALSVEINKLTGEFWSRNTFAGVLRAHGHCVKG